MAPAAVTSLCCFITHSKLTMMSDSNLSHVSSPKWPSLLAVQSPKSVVNWEYFWAKLIDQLKQEAQARLKSDCCWGTQGPHPQHTILLVTPHMMWMHSTMVAASNYFLNSFSCCWYLLSFRISMFVGSCFSLLLKPPIRWISTRTPPSVPRSSSAKTRDCSPRFRKFTSICHNTRIVPTIGYAKSYV